MNARPSLNKEEIIYNPIKDEEIRPFTSSSNNRQFTSVPNFNNIIPEIGVRIGIGNQSKNGGLNFKNQYGRMSMKEYEILREKYMGKGNEKNHPIHSINSQDFNYKNENINYSNNNNSKKNVQGSNDKIINYNWNNNTDNNSINNNNNLDNIPRTGKIMNENLFKNRTSKGIKTNIKNLNSNTGYSNFNNQVNSNQDYNNNQRTNLHSNSKRMGETNLRTRKK